MDRPIQSIQLDSSLLNSVTSPRVFRPFPSILALLLTVPTHVLPSEPSPQLPRGSSLTFEKHIRAILKANCFDCHGESDKPKAGLDLRLRRTILVGGESGPAIVPGKPGRSHLVTLLRAGDMPKREKKLTPTEIQLIENWI